MMQAAFPFVIVRRPAVIAIAAVLGVLPLGLMAASAQTRGRTQAPPALPLDPEALKQRGQELETLRAEQKKALENEARLKREIDAIGDDRRKFNQQIIDTASRVVSVEERIAQT